MIEIDKTKMWPFKYEPQTLDEMVLNPENRRSLEKVIKEVPNIMLVGPAGVGKGTFTNIFLRETGLDNIRINCSDETSIDNVRTKVKSFATALGITELKVVVMNEMDFLSIPAQAMLRDLIESVHKITRFIFMCNYGHKVIPEIQSRCQIFEMNNPPLKDMAKFVLGVLKAENVQFERLEDIVAVVKKLYPDIRRTINTLQMNTFDGKISTIHIANDNGVNDRILTASLAGDLDEIRKLVRSNMVNYTELYMYLYDNVGKFKSPGDMIILIGDHLYRDSIIAIKEVNLLTMLTKAVKGGCI